VRVGASKISLHMNLTSQVCIRGNGMSTKLLPEAKRLFTR